MNLRRILSLYFLFKLANCDIRNCCSGKNSIRAKQCVEGSLNDVLACPTRFLLRSGDVEQVNEEEGTLTQGIASVGRDSFCRTHLNDSVVYIVCYEEPEEPSNIIVFLGFASSFFLFLTIAIYLSLPKLMDLQGICIVHSILGLACGFIVMGINRLVDESSNIVCLMYAYLLYFSFLYAFFWLNTYCFHLWRTTIQPTIFAGMDRWKTIYYSYSCGCPILLLFIVICSQYSGFYVYTHPRMAEETICWFGTIEATFIYLYVPISILLTLNGIFFVWTIYGLWKEIHKYDGKKMKILRYRLSLCVKLFFVMGISWIFEVLSAAFEHKYPSKLWKIPDAINSLQGVLIFLVMVVFRKKVYRLLAEKPYGKMLPSTWRSIGGGEEECSESEQDYKLDQVNESA